MLNDLDSFHLAVRPDGRLLAGDVDLTELPSGPVTRRTLSQGEQINALAFSPDGSRMAAGDMTGRVALWDGTLRHRAGVLGNLFPAALGDTPEAVNALAFSPDGSTLAVAYDSGTLQLWDTATQQPLGGNLPTPGEPIRSLAFSSDSTTLYATSDHTPLQRYPSPPPTPSPRSAPAPAPPSPRPNGTCTSPTRPTTPSAKPAAHTDRRRTAPRPRRGPLLRPGRYRLQLVSMTSRTTFPGGWRFLTAE